MRSKRYNRHRVTVKRRRSRNHRQRGGANPITFGERDIRLIEIMEVDNLDNTLRILGEFNGTMTITQEGNLFRIFLSYQHQDISGSARITVASLRDMIQYNLDTDIDSLRNSNQLLIFTGRLNGYELHDTYEFIEDVMTKVYFTQDGSIRLRNWILDNYPGGN